MKATNPVPPGYKRTKVGVIPEEWEVVKLGDIASRSTQKNVENIIDVVFSNSALDGIVMQNDYFDKDIANRNNLSGYYIVNPGDFVYNPRISKYAPAGPINRNNTGKTGIVSPLYTVFCIEDSECIRFFEYYFKSTLWLSYMNSIANYGARHDRMNITVNDFMKMPLPLPPLKEQQKIAQILSTWDEAIAKLEALIEAKERFKKGLMQQLLSTKLRFPGFEGEWEEVRLGDVAIRITKKNVDNSIKLVFSNSATDGIVIQNDYFDKDIANKNNLSGYYIVEPGYFVYNPRISKSAPAGPISRNNKDTSGIVSPLYMVFHFKTSKFATFIEYYFKSMLWIRFMYSIANYGARHDRMNITIRDFMKMPLPFPSEAEQEKIVEILGTVDKELMLLKKEIKALKEQKRGLMQKLLSREVRVKL